MKTIFSKALALLIAITFSMNSYSASVTVSLSLSSFHGFNISCNGGNNGSITANVTTGVAPYTYLWSNGATTQTINSLAAGTYTVTVTDATSNTGTASATLTQPPVLNNTVTRSQYANGYNVSCFQCFNGSITATPSGGVSPYSYSWSFPSTAQNTNALGGGTYTVTITDANGCTKVTTPISMTEPPQGLLNWNSTGNVGTNPALNYIGTADNTDLVFRTNAVERLRLKGNGDVTIGGPFTAASDVHVLGNLSVNNISFANTNFTTLGYAALANLPPTVSYGGAPNSFVYSVDECVTPHLPTGALNHQFYGGIQLYGYNSSNWLNVMQVGFDGVNAIIDATGNSTDPYSNRLLLNYYCGRDVFVGNTTSGDLTANRNFYALGKVGIGISNPYEDLQIGNEFLFHNGGTKAIRRNVYFANNTNWRINSAPAVSINMNVLGDFSVSTALSGAAGTEITTADWIDGLVVKNNGNIGVGTFTPSAFNNTVPSFHPVIMHLKGQSPVIRLEDTEVNRPGYTPTNMAIESANGSGRIICDKGVAVFINANSEDSSPNSVENSFCVLSNHSAFESPVEELFRVNKDGRAFALSMEVTLPGGFSDFVFNDDYKLPSLHDLETYIKVNKHLPNVPTSAEIVKDGLDIGEMLKLQMQKIEELTLYMIELKKENDMLKEEVEKLKR